MLIIPFSLDVPNSYIFNSSVYMTTMSKTGGFCVLKFQGTRASVWNWTGTQTVLTWRVNRACSYLKASTSTKTPGINIHSRRAKWGGGICRQAFASNGTARGGQRKDNLITAVLVFGITHVLTIPPQAKAWNTQGYYILPRLSTFMYMNICRIRRPINATDFTHG